MLVPAQEATQHLIQEDRTLHLHCCEKFKLTSCTVFVGWENDSVGETEENQITSLLKAIVVPVLN
jgi:hypothetical protein